MGVDLLALNSLVRCRPRGLAGFLLAVLLDRRWRTGMREHAVSQLDAGLAQELGSKLVRAYRDLARLALTSEADQKVAVAAAHAVALLGGKPAAEALADVVSLNPVPSVRLAAALALGQVCHRASLPTLRRAQRDGDHKVRGAAKRALARCGWGKGKGKGKGKGGQGQGQGGV